MPNLFDLSGRVALVTGGSTGLGSAMSIALAEAGATIALVDHRERNETADEIRSMGREVLTLTAELTKMEDIRRVVAVTVSHFGSLDILVNNAGTIRRAPALEYSEKDWDDVMDLNAKGVFFLCQEAAKIMARKKKGKIINIASLLSFQGGITVPAYTASKGAVAQLTKGLANEWAKLGIQVNAIAPGYMVTSNTAKLREDQERFRQISERIPAGRWGQPEDLKGAVVFLASAASDYVNGCVLSIDGGWLAR